MLPLLERPLWFQSYAKGARGDQDLLQADQLESISVIHVRDDGGTHPL